jgi:hypothetical protein
MVVESFQQHWNLATNIGQEISASPKSLTSYCQKMEIHILAGSDGDKPTVLAMLQNKIEEGGFWKDNCLATSSLAKTYSRLFSVSMNQKVTVMEVFQAGVP